MAKTEIDPREIAAARIRTDIEQQHSFRASWLPDTAMTAAVGLLLLTDEFPKFIESILPAADAAAFEENLEHKEWYELFDGINLREFTFNSQQQQHFNLLTTLANLSTPEVDIMGNPRGSEREIVEAFSQAYQQFCEACIQCTTAHPDPSHLAQVLQPFVTPKRGKQPPRITLDQHFFGG